MIAAAIPGGLESGADDYLTKPFNADELNARLRTGERILNLEDKLVEAREQMRFKATHDALTSLWNRGAIMDLLGRELARSLRESSCTIPGPNSVLCPLRTSVPGWDVGFAAPLRSSLKM